MGCDIHAVMEIKINGRWGYYTEIEIGRDYELFGRMAGVRDNAVEPIANAKGLPEDLSDVAKLYFRTYLEESVFHNHSFLTNSELAQLYRWLVGEHGREWRDGVWDETENIDGLERQAARAICLLDWNDDFRHNDIWSFLRFGRIEAFRLVFAFDS